MQYTRTCRNGEPVPRIRGGGVAESEVQMSRGDGFVGREEISNRGLEWEKEKLNDGQSKGLNEARWRSTVPDLFSKTAKVGIEFSFFEVMCG